MPSLPVATVSLLDRLDAATESGDVDPHQLADAVGLTVARLRAALARPALLTADQVSSVARALGLDIGALRALRRVAAADDTVPAPHPMGRAPAVASADPPSLRALLEATVSAIAGDDPGAAALRRGVLDVAVAAAREARRVLPPSIYELRARLARGDFVAPPLSAERPDEDGTVLVEQAAVVVRTLQRAAPRYDGLFAPLDDAAANSMLRAYGVAVHALDGVPPATRAVLTPPLFGRHRLLHAAGVTADQRRLVTRVALAHLAAGHIGEREPLSVPTPAPLARLADLVALADLIPFWQLSEARRKGRLGWRALAALAEREAAALAGDWEPERSADRGELRVALFRRQAL